MRIVIRGLVLALSASFSFCASAQENTFVGEGSDTLMGIGARYVAMGGVGAAFSDDVYAIYSNPANLARISGPQISLSRQINAELIPLNFAGAAFRLPLLRRAGISTTVGLAYIPRLHFRASGQFSEDDFESVFLRYALPGLFGDFDGTVESKTKDYRIGFAFAPTGNERWSVGFSIGYIDCATFVCGASAQSTAGVGMITTRATAFTLNAGASFKLRDDLTLGISVKDLHTRLDVTVETTDENGTRVDTFETGFPTDLTIGLLWNYSDTLDFTADYQTMFGSYGSYDMDVRILRLGAEKRLNNYAFRLGMVVPITINSSKLPEIVLPFPVAPTAGVGWQNGRFSADLAVYAHPLMSYNKNGIFPAVDVTVTSSF